ncbi:MAG: hypothetical protein JWN50_568 [Parcubacteria group bacterium]|nr:hypothetical protein [Parcubacteria group bacterium]
MQKTAEQAESVRNATQANKGLELEYVETMLLKFTLGTREEVLPGIPEIRRDSQRELDNQHLTELEHEEQDIRVANRKAMRGRVRPGHIDTGFPVYNREEGVSVPTLAEGLMRNGYGFRDVHFFEQKKGRSLWVVVFAFEFGKPNAENVDELTKMYAQYAANSYTADVWDNPTLTSTVNLTRRQRGRARRKVVVASGKYVRIV